MGQPARSRDLPAYGIDPKTAAALTDPLRSRILMELDARVLSPSQLAEELGSDLNQVSRYFRQLEAWGLAEVVEVRPDRRRGAAVEHLYRGIPHVRLASSTGRHFPLECKKTSSAAFLKSFLDPMDAALTTGAFDEEPGRSFGWDEILIDATAWTQLLERLGEVSSVLSDLDSNSRGRLVDVGGERIPATVGFAAFPTAQPAEAIMSLPPRPYSALQQPMEWSKAVSPQLAKALSNPCRGKILAELGWRPMSPSQYVEEMGGDLSYVARCFRQLLSWGFLDVAEERRGGRNGGGVERIYRNSQRAYFGAPIWEGLPRRVREELSSYSVMQYGRCLSQAIDAAILRAGADHHLSWTELLLDRRAWNLVGEKLDQVLLWLPRLERESRERRGQDVEALMPATVALSCFRSD